VVLARAVAARMITQVIQVQVNCTGAFDTWDQSWQHCEILWMVRDKQPSVDDCWTVHW